MDVKEFKIQYALGTLSWEMRRRWAIGYNTPGYILKILSTDKDMDIRRYVARNENIPDAVLADIILNDPDRGTCRIAAEVKNDRRIDYEKWIDREYDDC